MTRPRTIADACPHMSASVRRLNAEIVNPRNIRVPLSAVPDVDASHDPYDVTPAKPTLRQDRRGMNKTETDFLAYLKVTHPGDFIFREGLGIRIGNGCVYWPDFIVESEWADGVTVYEVKGFMRDDAAVKIKAAASKFPSFKFYLVHRDKSAPGGWRIEEVLP